jgi:hypothetical protein
VARVALKDMRASVALSGFITSGRTSAFKPLGTFASSIPGLSCLFPRPVAAWPPMPAARKPAGKAVPRGTAVLLTRPDARRLTPLRALGLQNVLPNPEDALRVLAIAEPGVCVAPVCA